MLKYILRRLLHMVPVILLISVLIFGIIKLTPGNPVGANLNPKSTPAQKEMERERLGLNKPIYVQYFMWLQRTAVGDFGESYTYKKPVSDVIGKFIWNTVILNVFTFSIAFLISIPLGILSAVKQYTKFDNFITVFSLIGISLPSFFFGLVLIYIFAVKLKVVPVSGMVEAGSKTVDMARFLEIMRHMILPGVVLIIMDLASTVRYTRNGMLDVISQDYIRTARSKGLSEKVVIYKHAFRNALIPIVTILGFSIPALFSGAVIIETIFNWPGIGRILLESVNGRDYNLMMALMMFFAILTLLGNLLADIGYALVDPRVKVE